MDVLKEAITYFKGEAGFSRLFIEFANKVESLGQIGGTVTLVDTTPEEQKALRKWFGESKYVGQSNPKISLKKFEKSLNDTRFEGVNFQQLIEGVTERVISYRKDVERAKEEGRVTYFEKLAITYSCQYSDWLTKAIIHKEQGTISFNQAYSQKDFNSLENLYRTIKVLPLLPKKRLPVLAEQVIGDPHYFDRDAKLISALRIIKAKKEEREYVNESGTESVNELFYDFGILKDDIQNFVTCYGLIAVREGKKVASWEELYQENSILNVPLREMVRIEKVYPKEGNSVFIVENSGVFSSILDMHKGAAFPLICTHGQFKLAALNLIEKLINEDLTVYYSGDYDPEGLQMAQRLRRKFGKNIKFWRYTKLDYKFSVTDKNLSQLGYAKLLNIDTEDLLELKETMLKTGKVGYQERQIETLYSDIRSHYFNEN